MATATPENTPIFADLCVGTWFQLLFDDKRPVSFLKIAPISDKWGNVFVCVDEQGRVYDDKDMPEFALVLPCVKEAKCK